MEFKMSDRYMNREALQDMGLVTPDVSGLVAIERDAALRNAVIEAALDCIIMMDDKGIVVEFNPAAQFVFGYPRHEAVGAKLSDLIIPPALRAAHAAGLDKYLTTGEHKVLNQRVEVPAINKAGADLMVELAISPVQFDGKTFFSAYLRDITEAKAAEERLKASEERFQSLFELSPDAIVVMDESGVIRDANSRACELVALEKDELIGRNALLFPPADQVDKAVRALEAATNGSHVRVQIDIADNNGRRIPTEIVGRRMETSGGPLYHGVIRDITERRAAELGLRAAMEAAENASAAKSAFLANMSHEMRTPLNGVIGSLSLIDRESVGPDLVGFIQTAENSAETLLTLIDDLLDLSRIEAGEVDLEYTDFEPETLVRVVSDVFAPEAKAKSIDLSVAIDVPSGRFQTDVGKVRQILMNLVGNAFKFTHRGSIRIEAGYEDGVSAGLLCFTVSDTGIGISKTDQPLLFDRFKQADSSRSRSHGGAGLGLAICKELVEMLDGSISVSSAPGVGSVFRFKIPVVRSETVSQEYADESLPTALAGRILIAEDSQTNAMVAKTMLDRLGLQHFHVVDGAAAIDAALASDFDLILMDMSMPNIDGLEATRILRERGYDKPIIAMTAHALKEDRDAAIGIGMNSYLTKPVRPQALRAELANWLPEAVDDNEAEAVIGLDDDQIISLWGSDLDSFAIIAGLFLEELEWRLPKLKELPGKEREHLAHAIKGAASNVGAVELSQLAFQLEQIAQTASDAHQDELINKILREADCVTDQLRARYIEGGANGP
ncbi:MAG: hypothetical protein CME84_11700 [Henriciella sp.]|jgi:PAS domain S-box-containing protein|nr:hypothetical protein [Henriciella sp.]MBF32862.1 hypothetical protein [Hyphomonadaceae bacterium]PHR75878.1 MAG: hypothetical protein COA64_11525 [Henriciella sp.]|tara:strand:- start:11230 stop:13575 length:2346 start_codon:yes stop_codon:yes gene_type:complete